MKLISYRCEQIVRGTHGGISITYGHSLDESVESFLEDMIELSAAIEKKDPHITETYIVINDTDVSAEFCAKWDGNLMGQ